MAKQTIYAPWSAQDGFYLYQQWASAPNQHLTSTVNMTQQSDRAQVVWPVISATVWKAASDGSGNVVYSYKDLSGGNFAINQIVMVAGCRTSGFNTNNQVLTATRGWGAAITAVTTSSATEGTFTIVNATTGTEYQYNLPSVFCAAIVGPSCVITSVTGVATTATYTYSTTTGTLRNGQTIIIAGFSTAAYNQVGEIFNLTGSTFQLTITSTTSTQTPTNGYGTVAVDGLVPTNTALTADLANHFPATISTYSGDGVNATYTSATHGLVAGQAVQLTGLPINAATVTGTTSTGSAMTVTGGWAFGATNAFVGMWFTTSGYTGVDTNNNGGPFICTASSAGSITLTNPFFPTSGFAGSPKVTIVNGGFSGIFKVLSVPTANTFTAANSVNTGGAVTPTSAGTGIITHYETWASNDGGTSFFMKMEFGGYCSTTFVIFNPAVAVTLGTVDTNGILSTQTAREVMSYDGHVYTAVANIRKGQKFACDFYSNGSAFAMMLWRDGTFQSAGTASGIGFGWERSKNSSGTYTNDYVAYVTLANLQFSELGVQGSLFLSSNPGQGAAVIGPRTPNIFIQGNSASLQNLGASYQGWGDPIVTTFYPNVGYIGNPLTIFVTGSTSYVNQFTHNPEGLVKKATIAGQEHTYLFTNNAMFQGSTQASGSFVGMRWE